MDDDLNELTTKELLVRFKGILSFSCDDRQSKQRLIARILQDGPLEQVDFLRRSGRDKREAKGEQREAAVASHKRKRADYMSARRTVCRVELLDERLDIEGVQDGARGGGGFLQVPDEETVKTCYRAFYEATSNSAIAHDVCGVCARELPASHLTVIPLDSLPNADRLLPKQVHLAHHLVDGKLFEPAGILGEVSAISIRTCKSCVTDLNRKENKPPKFSLANNLWIGTVPWQLQVLTFPEQLLIALLYPRIYVFKLFPKKVGGTRDASTLQRGMRGTVSTYELSIDGVADMVQGNLLPRPAAVLASVISVTFIGLGQLPKRWLQSTFRVRRQSVFEALQWLKKNNLKYYGNIQISPERIAALPEDDVPDEVLGVVRQSEDEGVVDQESDGYVPTEEESPADSDNVSAEHQNHDDGNPGPDVIPLQILGAIDTDTSSLTASELMMWGLVNMWKEGKEGGYSV
ncbi:hypothetical protein EW026_g8214 [Hermanssonia centrifuga]|uniref:DUF6570 domain-containing protein n=1 Tax=Hermanssonia centrifuga TaxID=98765 RepID=A0A4S4K4Z8_9APHY|nr:hypothetical protein EW026_g8214 [Hermanssonia centrifuga]